MLGALAPWGLRTLSTVLTGYDWLNANTTWWLIIIIFLYTPGSIDHRG